MDFSSRMFGDVGGIILVQLLSHIWLFATPWTAVCKASCLRHLPEFAQTHVHRASDAIQPFHPLSSPFLLPSIFPSIRIFSNESALLIRWPKYWRFSFNISPSNEHPGLISIRMDWSLLGWTGWISLQSKGLSRVFSNTTVQKHQSFCTQLSLYSNSHIHTWPLEKP